MTPRRALVVLLALFATFAAGAATPDNDDSCDISVLPAATLLLPYFEVDVSHAQGETTLFTVTNVTNLDRIAHVTLWTDRAYPVINFNIYLTGYDVQSINLFDVIARGIIAPTAGTGTRVSPKRGMYSDPNPQLNLSQCERLPGTLDAAYVQRMQAAFTEGRVPAIGTSAACEEVGGKHDRAVGYATIDVVGACDFAEPTDPRYWTDIIRYDNVLIGDYQQIDPTQNFAQGGPLVHIRAVPEGGTPAQRSGADWDAGFERTFYSRYQSASAPKADGRQPLPSRFATRWIEGGASDFRTSLKVWREGRENACGTYQLNDDLDATEIVVFDENENAVGAATPGIELPATSRTTVADAEIYPQPPNSARSGWMYLNLDRNWRDDFASQNWVISSMRAEKRFSTDIDAMAMGNGCSADARPSEIARMNGNAIAPAPNDNRGTGVASTDNDDSCDIALLPAATLLLPYFEVDLDGAQKGTTTLFTVTNASPAEQIARVTLWTDWSYPVLSFNIYLTGYDVHSINLFDVLVRGNVAIGGATGLAVSPRGPYSARNPRLDASDCGRLPAQLSRELVERLQNAFTVGEIATAENERQEVGQVHSNAVGYATIDLVRNCAVNGPLSEEYWTTDLAYDNVLIGDYQQVLPSMNFGQGAPMVHVRAVPEGGTAAERAAGTNGRYTTPFQRTFYSRYQSPRTPMLDGRQPLPSTFAARWIQGGAQSFRTAYRIWREGKTTRTSPIGSYDDNMVKVAEMVRFDEAENAVGDVPVSRVCTPIVVDTTLPATSRTSVADASIYPQLSNGAIGGWFYINLDNCHQDAWGSQNWVAIDMRAEGRYSVEMDSAALGNGCSPPAAISEVTTGSAIIGPAPNGSR